MDQFEQLVADSAKQPRVLGIPLHPMISGQPLRIKSHRAMHGVGNERAWRKRLGSVRSDLPAK
jgi:hypothetical protein